MDIPLVVRNVGQSVVPWIVSIECKRVSTTRFRGNRFALASGASTLRIFENLARGSRFRRGSR
jgi:hypothetical protein